MAKKTPSHLPANKELQPLARLFLQRENWNTEQLEAEGINKPGRLVSRLNDLKGWEITATHRAGTSRKLRQYFRLTSPADFTDKPDPRPSRANRSKRNSSADTTAMMNAWARKSA